jgi:long-chain acyl-CoA synthetase
MLHLGRNIKNATRSMRLPLVGISRHNRTVLTSFKSSFIHSSSVLQSGDVTGKIATAVSRIKTIPEIVLSSAELFPDSNALGTRVGDSYEWITYTEFAREVQKLRNVLSHHQIEKGDKVALISNNRVEWAVTMYAVTGMGAQLVPMYEAQLEKDWKYIINDSDSKLAIVSTEIIHDKVNAMVGKVGKLSSVLCMNASDEYSHSFHRWMKQVESEDPVPLAEIHPSDLSTIIYTSGTTGQPKGVELTHDNVVQNCAGLHAIYDGDLESHTSLAFLPWAHVFGQTAELHSLLASGSALGIVSSREQILESIPIIKPTIIMSVPILFNKVYNGVQKAIGEGSTGKKALFNAAMKVSRERNELLEFGKPVGAWLDFKHKLADKIIFSKIRERLGGRLQFMSAGGAATSVEVLQFFEDIGISICEGYGLTETAPVISTGGNNWNTRRLGCVGVPLPGNTVYIRDPETGAELPADTDGEICVAGRNVMKGYRNNEAANEEVFFQANGKKFFRTGDLGRMVEGKFLKVTGRIKEQFKLENGKYVVPAPLEDALTRSQFIAQTFLYGDNKPHTVVLVVGDAIELRAWGQKQGLPFTDESNLSDMVKYEEVLKLLGDELKAVSGTLKAYERPKQWIALEEAFSPDNQMLTAKLSIRRNNIMAAYSSIIDDLYSGSKGHDIN